MKHVQQTIIGFVLIFYCLPSFAQTYRVQLAAYVKKVPFSHFSEVGIHGVYMLTDQNNIFRYYIGEFDEQEKAKGVQQQAIAKGFKYASIIDIEEQRKLCGKPCPYISPSSTYSDESTEILNLSNIFFGFDQSKLTMEAKRELDRVAAILQKNSNYKILVSGHTDSMGDAKYNIELSKRRARTARSYLINKGIKSKKIMAQVFGESEPEKDNFTSKGEDSPEGRKFNRRVVLAIYDPNNSEIILSNKR
ncbi:MAG: OmpA family protein [Bacteroidota bacterium]